MSFVGIGVSISKSKTGHRVHVRSTAAVGDVPTGDDSVIDFEFYLSSDRKPVMTSDSKRFVVKGN